jgi:hypothetical protein
MDVAKLLADPVGHESALIAPVEALSAAASWPS